MLTVSRYDWFSYIFVHRPGAGLKLAVDFFIPALLALYVPNGIK